MNTVIISCIAMAILGQWVQILFIAIPSIKKKAAAANQNFSWRDWWASDFNLVLGTMVIIGAAAIGLKEIANWKPEIMNYVRWFFFGIGAFGSNIAMSLLSKYQNKLMALLDIKANVADTVTGGTNSVQETIDKGSEATGKDIPTKIQPMDQE